MPISRKIVSIIFISGMLIASQPVSDQFLPNEVIVKLAPSTQLINSRALSSGIPQLDLYLDQYGFTSIEPLFPNTKPRRSDLPDISRIYRVRYQSDVSPLVISQMIESIPEVLYAEPNLIAKEMEVPNDPMYTNQWHLDKIKASAAWDISHGDTNVVIAIVDGSFDLQHEDLQDNWFTNWAEYHGTPGVDDDGNGYIDDISGWDFVYDDNDPNYGTAETIHGTHVAGILNAVTDNNVGIAGVAWNVKMLPLKCGLDVVSNSIINGYSAIVYAAEMGADVINNSWGGDGYTQYGEDVVTYATGLGALVIAAAGNGNSSVLHSPSSLQQVLSVAATDVSDLRSSFSNFGLTVDVAAPGSAIYSSFTLNNYASISGTSMSSPVVSGLAALVKSVYPNLTPQELALRIAGTTDNIDALNPDYVGLLGSGRVNAYKAVIYETSQFVDIPPRIGVWAVSANDTVQGNSNGILDRDEIVYVSATFRNFSLGTANDFYIELSSNNPSLTILNGVSSTSAFPADTELVITNELSFQISNSAEAGMAELSLDIYINGTLDSSSPVILLIGKTPVLLVDDDDGSTNVDGFYTGIWDEQGIKYGVWDHSVQGSPSADVLKAFPIVIWVCEWAFPTLDFDDRAALREYLDAGGNLYVSGQDLGWDLNDYDGISTEESKSFYREYLHALWGGDVAGVMNVKGIHGDVIGNNLSFNVWQPGYPLANQYPDYFTPDSSAKLIFEYSNHLGMGLRYSDEYRLVYTGVGLETFGSNINSVPPADINDVQRTALTRILSYLNFVHHVAYTDVEDTTSNFKVVADNSGDVSDLLYTNLLYRYGTTGDYTNIAMADSGSGRFVASIPAPNMSTTIEYYIDIANSYYQWTNPVGAPGNTFSFYAGQDTVLPSILSVNKLENRIDRSGLEEIITFVDDNIGVDSVFLNWYASNDPGTVNRYPMDYYGPDWRADLAWLNLPGNTVVTYQVEVIDQSSNHNVNFSDPLTFVIINTARITNWEKEDLSGWDTGQSWGSQFINTQYGYGVNDFPDAQYQNNADNSLTMVEPFDLSSYNQAYIQFWNGVYLQPNEDFGYIELSADGDNWTTVSTITGLNVTGIQTIDVTDYIDTGVLIRFRMTSDGQNTSMGWYVDDINILVDTTIVLATIDEQSYPISFSLLHNYPNPFNPSTNIAFTLDVNSNVTVKVFSLLGVEVATIHSGSLNPGIQTVKWNGIDNYGLTVASGIYLYRIEAGDRALTGKMMLLK